MRRNLEVLRLRVQDYFQSTRLGHGKLRRGIMRHFQEQQRHWAGAYVQEYFYQRLQDIGIMGAKPTRFRFEQEEVDALLNDADVLDIGSNTGFVSIYCAQFAKSVVGIELNPYLNRVARDVSEYLGYDNTEFQDLDFGDFESSRSFNGKGRDAI